MGLSLLSLRAVRAGLAAAAVALVLWSHHFERADLRLSTAWDQRKLPVRAARFIAAQVVSPPFFNGLTDGGYLDLTLGTSFFDAREFAVPAAMLHEWLAAERSPAAFQAWLREVGAEWTLTTRHRERLGGYRLLGPPDWTLVYWDDLSEVFVRRDAPRLERRCRSNTGASARKNRRFPRRRSRRRARSVRAGRARRSGRRTGALRGLFPAGTSRRTRVLRRGARPRSGAFARGEGARAAP